MSHTTSNVHNLASSISDGMESEARQGLLTSSAFAIMKQNYNEELNIQNVAARAGVRIGSFYDHFSGMEEFLIHINDVLFTNYRKSLEAIDEYNDPASKLAAFVHCNLAFAKNHQDQCFVLFHNLWTGEGKEISDYMKSLISSIIDEGIAKGQFTVILSPADIDTVLGSLGLAVKRTFDNVALDSDYDKKITANILRSLGLVSPAALERAQKGF